MGRARVLQPQAPSGYSGVPRPAHESAGFFTALFDVTLEFYLSIVPMSQDTHQRLPQA